MKRYFFHRRENGGLVEDTEGHVFPSLQAAHDVALVSVRKMVSELASWNIDIDGRTLEICNQHGNLLLAIPFTKLHERYLKS